MSGSVRFTGYCMILHMTLTGLFLLIKMVLLKFTFIFLTIKFKIGGGILKGRSDRNLVRWVLAILLHIQLVTYPLIASIHDTYLLFLRIMSNPYIFRCFWIVDDWRWYSWFFRLVYLHTDQKYIKFPTFEFRHLLPLLPLSLKQRLIDRRLPTGNSRRKYFFLGEIIMHFKSPSRINFC